MVGLIVSIMTGAGRAAARPPPPRRGRGGSPCGSGRARRRCRRRWPSTSYGASDDRAVAQLVELVLGADAARVSPGRAARGRATPPPPGARASRAGAPRSPTVANASCSAASRLTPPTYSGSRLSGGRASERGAAPRRRAGRRAASPVATQVGECAHDATGQLRSSVARRGRRPGRRRCRRRAGRRPSRPRRSTAPPRRRTTAAGAARAARCGPARRRPAGRPPPPRARLTRDSSWLVSWSRSSSARCAEAKKSATARRCAAGSGPPLVGEVVDEVAVPAVGGHAARRRVRLRRCSPRARGRSSRCGSWRWRRRGRSARAIVCEPTGCAVSTYSSTIARRIDALRSSSSSGCSEGSSGTQSYRVPTADRPRGRFADR